MDQEGVFNHLIGQLTKLPGIGRKSAQRMAFFLLKMPADEAKKLGLAIIDVKDKLSFCQICNNVTEGAICLICRDPRRDTQKILVVEEPSTLYLIEKTGRYRGTYHVLLGTLSPLTQVTALEPTFKNLIERVEKGGVSEVILATSLSMEGEAVALYLNRLLKPFLVTVTRIACGIPFGIDLEYVDEVTLSKSLEGRRELSHAS